MTHPTNKTPAMIRNVVGHQPEQAGGPVPAPRVPSLPNQLAINKRAEGSMKQSATDNVNVAAETMSRREAFFVRPFAFREIERRKALLCEQSFQREDLQDRARRQLGVSRIITVVAIRYNLVFYSTVQIADWLTT